LLAVSKTRYVVAMATINADRTDELHLKAISSALQNHAKSPITMHKGKVKELSLI
jgi:isocitrate dehydrogenase